MENTTSKAMEFTAESGMTIQLTEEEQQQVFIHYVMKCLVPGFLDETEGWADVLKNVVADAMCSRIELADGCGELALVFAPMLLKLKKDGIQSLQSSYEQDMAEAPYPKEYFEEFESKLLYWDVDNQYPGTECLNDGWLWENVFGDEEDGECEDCVEDEDGKKKQGFNYSNLYYVDKLSKLTGVRFEQVAYTECAGSAVEYYFYCKREAVETLTSMAAEIKHMVKKLEGFAVDLYIRETSEEDPVALVLAPVLD